MTNPMKEIIQNLLCADVQLKEKGTHDLNESYNHPETTIPALFDLVIKAEEASIRRYSAVLLCKNIRGLQTWQIVSHDIEQEIKSSILNKILEEKHCSVRTAMCRLFGAIKRHESNKSDGCLDSISRLIFEYCSSPDSNVSEMGSDVFAKLANAAPEEFIPHINAIYQMFMTVMTGAEASGHIATPVIQNIVAGMKALVPVILGHNDAEQTYSNFIPYIIKALFAMSKQPNVEMFRSTFEFLEVMLADTPKLLNSSIKALMEFCMVLGKDETLDPVVRSQTVAFLGSLAEKKNVAIIKQNLLEPVLGMIFELMASPSSNDEEYIYFLDPDAKVPKATAAEILNIMVLNMPPKKLMPPLLAILESAFQNNDPLKRIAAYVCMANIFKGCSDAIRGHYLLPLFETIQKDIADADVMVRNAAFFALSRFPKHMESGTFEYADQILSIILHHFEQLSAEVKGRGVESNMESIECLVDALCAYLENLDQKVLTPCMPKLMEIAFKALNPENPANLHELAMQVIYCACNSVQDGILPYFGTIIQFLQPYLVKSEQEDIVFVQPQAIDTLGALALSVGPENFIPLAVEAIRFGVMMLEAHRGNQDPDINISLYNFFKSLSIVVKNEMSPAFEKIIEPIFDSVSSKAHVLAKSTEDNIDADFDLSHLDDDGNNIHGQKVDKLHFEETEAAILALQGFARNSAEAFQPYLKNAFETIYKSINHQDKSVRKACIKTLTEFTMLFHEQNDQIDIETAIKALLPQLGKIILDEKDFYVGVEALQSIAVILEDMKQTALPNQEIRDSIYNCIKAVLEFKTVYQLNLESEDDDSEVEEYNREQIVFDLSADLLTKFGAAMEPQQFTSYFEGIAPLLVELLDKKSTNNYRRNLIYIVLGKCFLPLGTHCKMYFDKLYPMLINGFNGTRHSVIFQGSIYALGELVFCSEETSFNEYPIILQALSNAVIDEEEPGVLDNICGAIARLIITNYTLVPLEQVLPVFFQHLPLREEKADSLMILKCLNVLYLHALNIVEPMLDKFITITVASITDDDDDIEEEDDEMLELGLNLLSTIQNKYPNQFASVLNSVPPEQNQKLQTLIQNRAN